MVTEYVVTAVGVPEITPVFAFSVKVAGNPVCDHVYGGVPPLPGVSVVLYATFCSPLGNEVVPIEGAGLIVRLYACDAAAPAASVTVIVAEYGPAAVGVPDTTPVPELIVSPGGRPL
jgi:hypothetical protein